LVEAVKFKLNSKIQDPTPFFSACGDVNLNWTVGPIHADSEHMKSTAFGERILPGVCVLSTTIGLANTSRIRGLMNEHGFKLVALLGFESVRFTSAVYPGDTITVESEILDARASSAPKRCVARLKDVTRRQTGDRPGGRANRTL
jgi:acyl dehydratase